MQSEALEKARSFEKTFGPHVPPSQRPKYHITPLIGWMNDPNGFSVYRGEYHLFHQYYPYGREWGPMHWGHLKSRDLIRWEYLPAALAPDEPYDAGGCFSGGAVELPDGRQLLLYTGVRRECGADGFIGCVQTQCVAVGDGVDYVKYAQNPVLTHIDLPRGGSAADFRDPKLWQESDGSYRMVVGNRIADGHGAVLLYESRDGFDWHFVRTIDECHGQYGSMWECPDFFPLDGRQVLIVSPQDMAPVELEFHVGDGTLCLIGDYSEEKGFTRYSAQSVDYGLDFYAPQTLLAPDGRRIMVAWMQNWSTAAAKPDFLRWMGQMTVPRELSIRNGRLCQLPVRELEHYRGQLVSHHRVLVSREINVPGVSGRVLDMTATIRPIGGDSFRRFRIRVAKDGEHETTICYDAKRGTILIDRTRSGLRRDIVHTRSFFVQAHHGELKLRILLDRFSVELFVNDGEQAASTVIYTRPEADAITFEAEGQALVDIEKYELVFPEEETEDA